MTDGTSQGLFIVVAIVIFGIFVVLAYILFEDTLSPAMASMFNTASEQTNTSINVAKYYHVSNSIPTEGDMFEFENGIITNYIGSLSDVVIPYEIGGETVVGIGDFAFNDKNLLSVVIPNTVQTIGNHAFLTNKISTLYLPDSIKSIGVESFEENRISDLHIGRGLTELPSESFRSNRLTTVNIPRNIKVIKEYVFSYNHLVEITIPKTVNELGHIFIGGNSASLERIRIPKGLKPSIDADAAPYILSRNGKSFTKMTEEEKNELYDSNIIEYY